jgi:hypothetical protein
MSSENSVHLEKTLPEPFDAFRVGIRVRGKNAERNCQSHICLRDGTTEYRAPLRVSMEGRGEESKRAKLPAAGVRCSG